MQAPDWILVHGAVAIPNTFLGVIGHAWLERDDIVYDPVWDIVMTQAEYRTFRRAQCIHRYTLKEAGAMILEHGIYGPWTNDSPR
jgi:hypothetical protein